jgi:hypothetical protein
VSLPSLGNSHVLQLDLPRPTGVHELQMADDLPVHRGYQDTAEREVGVEFGRGILGEFEQHTQNLARIVVALNPDLRKDVVHGAPCLGRRLLAHGCFTRTARV